MTRHAVRLLVVAAVAVVVYALLWVGYRMHWSWLDTVDSTAVDAAHDYGVRHPGWVRGWDVFCTVFGPAGFRVAGAVVIVVAVVRRNLRAVLFVVVTIELSGIATLIGKSFAARPRPAGALVAASSTSFPSGHAVAVTAGALALLALSSGTVHRVLTVVAGAVIVVAIGVGRVVLAVHHPSDVVAGWALGYVWFAVWLLVIRPLPFAAAASPDPSISDEATDETPEARGSER